MSILMLKVDCYPVEVFLETDARRTRDELVSEFLAGNYDYGQRGLLAVYEFDVTTMTITDISLEMAKEIERTLDAEADDCSGIRMEFLKAYDVIPDHVRRIEGGLWLSCDDDDTARPRTYRHPAEEHALSGAQLGVGRGA